MNRRKFLAFLAAGGVVTATGLWLPEQKLISIPKREVLGPYHIWPSGRTVLGGIDNGEFIDIVVAGELVIDGTCTNGVIRVTGHGTVIDNSAGARVVNSSYVT